MLRLVTALLALALTACAAAPPHPAPFGDAGPPAAGDCPAMCANLATLDCTPAVGGGPNCEQACRTNVERRTFPVDVACLTHARTCEAARACGRGQ